MLLQKFLKASVQDWLKSHVWTLVAFTDSLISSSNKISIEITFNFVFQEELFLGGSFSPPPPPVDKTLTRKQVKFMPFIEDFLVFFHTKFCPNYGSIFCSLTWGISHNNDSLFSKGIGITPLAPHTYPWCMETWVNIEQENEFWLVKHWPNIIQLFGWLLSNIWLIWQERGREKEKERVDIGQSIMQWSKNNTISPTQDWPKLSQNFQYLSTPTS